MQYFSTDNVDHLNIVIIFEALLDYVNTVAFLLQPTKHPAALVRILQKVLPRRVAI